MAEESARCVHMWLAQGPPRSPMSWSDSPPTKRYKAFYWDQTCVAQETECGPRALTVGYTVAIQDSSDEDGSPESLVGPFADGASELQSDSENFFTDVASDVEGGVDFLPNLCADRARMLADRAETLRGEDEFLKELLDCSVPASSEKQKKYKYGGCRIHPSCSLQPHLAMGGKKPGALKLRCSKWFKFHA
ncbi:unnamed protein product, partial [Effrenium voratum]